MSSEEELTGAHDAPTPASTSPDIFNAPTSPTLPKASEEDLATTQNPPVLSILPEQIESSLHQAPSQEHLGEHQAHKPAEKSFVREIPDSDDDSFGHDTLGAVAVKEPIEVTAPIELPVIPTPKQLVSGAGMWMPAQSQ